MNDIVNAFKSKASAGSLRKKKNGLDIASTIEKQTPQPEQKPAQDSMSNLLASSQKQNVQQDMNAGAKVNAEIAQAQAAKAAAEQAAAAQAAAAKATEATKKATQNAPKVNDDGWKKYYDEEFKKARDSQGFFERLFDNGQASKSAEVAARNRYTSELLNKAYDDNGNVLDQAAADKAKGVANYNTDVARNTAEQSYALGRAIGARYDSDVKDNRFLGTVNAIRNMSVGDAILGANDTQKTDMQDVGKFLLDLLPGMATAPIQGAANLTEAATGRGLDSSTGRYKDLSAGERLGRGISGGIDVAGTFFGGTGDLLKSAGNAIFKKGATEATKQAVKKTSKAVIKDFLKAMASEGAEEGFQQAAEFFGNGGSLTTADGKFDNESFKELLAESGQAAALGAIGGGIFEAGAKGINAGRRALSGRKNANTDTNISNNYKLDHYTGDTNVNENAENVDIPGTDVNENVDTNENVDENVDENVNENTEVTNPTPTTPEQAVKVQLDERITALKNNAAQSINAQQKTQLDNYLQEVVKQLNEGKITAEQAAAYVDNLQKRLDVVTQQNQATQAEESATGQPTNPNEVTAVQNAEGTQAADNVDTTAPSEPSGDIVTEQEGMQDAKTLEEGMAQIDTAETVDDIEKLDKMFADNLGEYGFSYGTDTNPIKAMLRDGDISQQEYIREMKDVFNYYSKYLNNANTNTNTNTNTNVQAAETQTDTTSDDEVFKNIQDKAQAAYEEASARGDREAMAKAKERYDLAFDIRSRQDVAGYNVDNGVVINDMLAEKLFNDGYDAGRELADSMFNVTEGNAPIAYDYTTKEPIYTIDDLTAALERDGYTDAAGNQYRSAEDFSNERNNDFEQAIRDAANDTTTIEDLVNTATEPAIDQDFDDRVTDLYGELETQDKVRGGSPIEPDVTMAEQVAQGPEVVQPAPDYASNYEAVASQYKSELDNTGMTPELLRKIYTERYNAKQDGRTPDLNSVLTPEEQKVAKDYFTAKAFGDEKSAADMYNSAYVTAQNEDTEYTNRALLELVDTGTLRDIYQNYQGLVTPDNFDASGNADVDWMIREKKPDALIQSAAQDFAQDIAPDATPEQVSAASQDIVDVVKELNNKAENASNNGVKDSDIANMKPLDKLESAGEKLRVQKEIIDAAPRGLSDDAKLKNLNQWYQGAYFGVAQNINGFANDTAENVDSFIQSRFESLTDKQRSEILSGRNKLMEKYTNLFGDEKVAEYYTNRAMLKSAFSQNLMNYGTKVQFTNKASKKLMNEYYSRYLLQDRYTQSVAKKIASGIQRVMNSSFRGMRLQTTLNEIPEIMTSIADYHIGQFAKPSECQAIKAKYGMANGNSLDQALATLPKEKRAEVQAELDSARNINEQMNILKKAGKWLGKQANNVDTATQWNGFIQDWKDATFLKNAEAFYSAKGMSGAELKMQVLNDFEERMLPMSRVFKIIKSDSAISKPFLMYLDASARLTRKAAKGAVGLNTTGVNKNYNVAQRIGNNLVLDLVPRMASAMVMGVPLASVIGLFNIGGDDYTGISDEDKNEMDNVINFAGQLSPMLSLLSNAYFNKRQDEIAEARGTDPSKTLKGDWTTRTLNNIGKTFTPLGNRLDQDWGIFGNINSAKDVLSRGYAVNKDGRVQYLGPDNLVDVARTVIGGSNRTSNAREYNNNPDLLSALINEARGNNYDKDARTEGGILDFFTKNAALNSFPLDLGLKNEDDYNRPAINYDTANYNKMIQDAMASGDRETAQDWYNKSRAYNAILDDLRVNNPAAIDVYYAKNGANVVSPEKYKMILYGMNNQGQPDLTVWNAMKEMALAQQRDFNTDIDPAYTDLDDEQTRRYLQYKSTATGEDTALSKIMKTDPFWKEFFKKQQDYYSKNGFENDDSNKTPRVQQWNALNKQMSGMYQWDGINSSDPEEQQAALRLQMTYPTMYAYNSLKTALEAKYGDEYKSSPEYKQFWSDYGDAYENESNKYNEEMLYIINQMRTIEGYDELTLDELETINGIGRSSSKKSGSGGGGGSSNYSYVPFFENIFNASPVYTAVRDANGFSYKKAKGVNFYDVPMSGTYGKDPYAPVV